MMRVTFKDKTYEFELKEILEGLTGKESLMCEEYLGGWPKFRDPNHLTRSTVVTLWLAMRSAGETATFDEIEAIPGLLFGDAWQLQDDESDLDGQSPPADTPQTTTVPKPSSLEESSSLHLQSLSERAS